MLTVFGALIWLLVRQQKATTDLLKEQNTVALKHVDLLEKAFTQLRSADPWQYQQAMYAASPVYDEPYDPSEEADARRIAERQNNAGEMEEALNGSEAAALEDLFPGAGL